MSFPWWCDIIKSQQHQVKRTLPWTMVTTAATWKHGTGNTQECSNSDLSPLRASGTGNKDMLSDPATYPKCVRTLHVQLLFLKTNSRAAFDKEYAGDWIIIRKTYPAYNKSNGLLKLKNLFTDIPNTGKVLGNSRKAFEIGSQTGWILEHVCVHALCFLFKQAHQMKEKQATRTMLGYTEEG